MATVNKKTFDVEFEDTVDGAKVKRVVKMAVIKPGHKVAQKATLVYNKSFREAVESGLMVRGKLEKVLREQNLWDDEKQKKYSEIVTLMLGHEKALATGGIKLSEARQKAIEMRRAREQMRNMSSDRNDLDQKTAEAWAEQGKFNYLVAACTVYSETGKPYFKDVESYLDSNEDPVVMPAAEAMGRLVYGLEDDYDAKLPENAFLLKHKLCDVKLKLVNKAGKLVDEFNNLVDVDGWLVNELGERIDRDGTKLTDEGGYKVEFTEFVDDLSEPVAVEPTVEVKTEAVVEVTEEKIDDEAASAAR